MFLGLLCFVILRGISGDVCNDFCITKLGRFGCPNGSWCKNNYDCHSLFWTSANDREDICIYTGREANCTNDYPVLCADVPRSVGINLVYRDPLVDHRPHIKMSLMNTGQNRGFPMLFDTGSSRIIVAVRNRSIPVNSEYYAYANDDQLNDPVDRPAYCNEYFSTIESALSALNGQYEFRLHTFGTDCRVWGIVTFGFLTDTVRLFSGSSTFEFQSEVYLAHPPNRPADYLLGANKMSSFARSAKVFAYIGSYAYLGMQNHLPQFSKWYHNGYCVIGPDAVREAERTCSGGRMFIHRGVFGHRRRWRSSKSLTWFNSPSERDWVINGGIQLGNGPIQELSMHLDTGASASNFHVTSEIENELISRMLSLGYVLKPPGTDSQGGVAFTNCTPHRGRWADQLPPIHYYFWNQTIHDSVRITIPARRYTFWSEDGGDCGIGIQNGLTKNGSELLVGTRALYSMATVFDLSSNRIGIC